MSRTLGGRLIHPFVAMTNIATQLAVGGAELVDLPVVPSVFDSDEANRGNRSGQSFLHGFDTRLDPRSKDGSRHIERAISAHIFILSGERTRL